MTGPDLGMVRLEWSGRLFLMRYPLGALRELQKMLSIEGEVGDVGKLSKHVSLQNLGVFLWASLLHRTRGEFAPAGGDPEPSLEQVQAFVEWGYGPQATLLKAVRDALFLSVLGSVQRAPEDQPKLPKEEPAAVMEAGPGQEHTRRPWLRDFVGRLKSSGGGSP